MSSSENYLTDRDEKVLGELNLPLSQVQGIRRNWMLTPTPPKKRTPITIILRLFSLVMVGSLGATYVYGIKELHYLGLFLTAIYMILIAATSCLLLIALLALDDKSESKKFFLDRNIISDLRARLTIGRAYYRLLSLCWIVLLIMLGHYLLAVLATFAFLTSLFLEYLLREVTKRFLADHFPDDGVIDADIIPYTN